MERVSEPINQVFGQYCVTFNARNTAQTFCFLVKALASLIDLSSITSADKSNERKNRRTGARGGLISMKKRAVGRTVQKIMESSVERSKGKG
jgi:hypothetical protein